MPISKIKTTGVDLDNLEIGGTEAARMPQGTTAQRANAQAGDIRYNSTLDSLEQYKATGWEGISSPPVVASVSPDNIDESDTTQTLVVTGSAFDTLATAVLLTSGNVTRAPTTSVRNSATQITMTYSGSDTLTTDEGPYSIKVTNGTGLSATLSGAVTLDDAPNWSTSAGSLGTVFEDEAITTITVAATDPENGTISYSVTSGALPTGLSLGSANGQITGTPNVNDAYSASGTTHNFTITASDGTGNTTPRAFSILKRYRDGTVAAPASLPSQLRFAGVADGVYKFAIPGYYNGAQFDARYATYNSKGWIEVLFSQDSGTQTPWQHWLSTTGGYDGNQTDSSKYWMINHNRVSGGLNYAAGTSGSILLGPQFPTSGDIAFTTKSSRSANGVAASGANQSSAYPLLGSQLSGSDASTVKTELIKYFLGTRAGFHASNDSGGAPSGRDYNATWSKSSLSFDIVLAHRTGSPNTTEWHIQDGVQAANSTYSPNYGYRYAPGNTYDQDAVGSWSTGSSAKASTYNIDSGNVMSIWITDE